jgi:hypothetical protein
MLIASIPLLANGIWRNFLVITGDLIMNIIQHESLRKVISHGPKFREPQHINWKHKFKIIMDAVEDYARRWIKREVDQDPELESLSDWVRTEERKDT